MCSSRTLIVTFAVDTLIFFVVTGYKVFSPAALVASTKYLPPRLAVFCSSEGVENIAAAFTTARKQNFLLACGGGPTENRSLSWLFCS
jgi:hypothetical protein